MRKSSSFFALTNEEVRRTSRYGFYYFSDVWLLWLNAPDSLVSDELIGELNVWLTPFFFLVGAIVLGHIHDVKGRKASLIRSIGAYLSGQLICTILVGYALANKDSSCPFAAQMLYLLARLLVIFGIAGGLGSSLTQVVEGKSSEKRTAIISIFTAIGILGVVGSTLVELVFEHITKDGIFGKLTSGILGICVGFISLYLTAVYERPNLPKKASSDLLNLKNVLESTAAIKKFYKQFLLIFSIGLPTFFIVFIINNCSSGFFKFHFQYNDNYETDNVELWSRLLGYLGIAIGALILGLDSERRKNRKTSFHFANGWSLLLLICIYCFPYNNDLLFFFFLIFLLGLGSGSWALMLMYSAEVPVMPKNRGIAYFIPPNLVRFSPFIFSYLIDSFITKSQWEIFQGNASGELNLPRLESSIFVIFLIMVAFSTLCNILIENNYALNLSYPLSEKDRTLEFVLGERKIKNIITQEKRKLLENKYKNTHEYYNKILNTLRDDTGIFKIFGHRFYFIGHFQKDEIDNIEDAPKIYGEKIDSKEKFIIESNFSQNLKQSYNFLNWLYDNPSLDYLIIYAHPTKITEFDEIPKCKVVFAKDLHHDEEQFQEFTADPKERELLLLGLRSHLTNATLLETSYFLYLIKPEKNIPEAFVLLLSEPIKHEHLAQLKSIFRQIVDLTSP